MEQKNRLGITLAITMLILLAMLISFGRSLFTGDLPHVVLPAENVPSGSHQDNEPNSESSNQFLRVEVTPETVQNVIATLSRSNSYYREVTIENFWDDTYSNIISVQIWVDNGWSHCKQTLPSGLIRHDLIGQGQVCYWYEGDRTWMTAPADQTSADIAQSIPTYETVLALAPDSITAAGYEMQEDFPCIFVEAQSPVAGYTERYWVCVDSGLLVRAQTLEGENLVYSMSALTPIQSPAPLANDTFALPDGTVLYAP